MGFGKKWIGWIHACLRTSTVSILQSGSPTKEFSMGKGLRQGDPMALFLFLLVAENLNLLMEEAVDKCLFQEFFRLISGMRINMRKSKLYGVWICEGLVDAWARGAGCIGGELPFIYLGIPVVASMRKRESWKPVIEKLKDYQRNGKKSTVPNRPIKCNGAKNTDRIFNKRMQTNRPWPNVLGELERVRKNFFWGGGEGSKSGKKVRAWFNWEKTVSSLENGGLNIWSLATMNQALLAKWWWRFFSDNEALWNKVIKSLYEGRGGIERRVRSGREGSSIWCNVLGVVKELDEFGLNSSGSFRRVVGEAGDGILVDLESNTLTLFLHEDADLLKSAKGKHWWVGLKWCFLYLVWQQRNKLVFNGEKSLINDIFFEWQRVAFEWMSFRLKEGIGDCRGSSRLFADERFRLSSWVKGLPCNRQVLRGCSSCAHYNRRSFLLLLKDRAGGLSLASHLPDPRA
ncbi:hypothetical protein OSB04_001728 [Centaurea solstitialis]|uniref:Reverse transcriptase domain-containing protein n=1 Tax=Centaurea solstitialis TaxID=347529 RepID=A0AA38WM12_9ASTR|nr:hypothetical protein OSB04_001728 [Centaurea solstitialis]